MRIISYCHECMKCFEDMPSSYWILYRSIVEEVLTKGKHYKLLSNGIVSQATEQFIKDLEEKNLIVTHDNEKYLVSCRPNGLNHITFEYHPEIEMIKICLEIDKHYAYQMDENVLEE